MKTDIDHLPQDKQDELRRITEIIREAVEPVFPRSTPEEEKRFDLLKRAYVDARYDPAYTVTREDLEYLGGRVRALKTLAEETCRKKIESLGG